MHLLDQSKVESIKGRRARIVFLQPGEPFGGAERQGAISIKRLPEFGVDVLSLIGPGLYFQQALRDMGIDDYIYCPTFVRDGKYPLSTCDKIKRTGHFVKSWWSSVRFVTRAAKQYDADLIYASRSFSWTVAGIVAHKLGIKSIWRAGSRPTDSFQKIGLDYFGRYRPPDALICNCDSVLQSISKHLRVPSFIVKNGVDTHRFDPKKVEPTIRKNMGISPNTPVLGIAARPAPEKGVYFLADLIKVLKENMPGIRVLFAGDCGWREHVEQYFFKNNLKPSVTFLGHIQEIETFYKSCDVILLVSPEKSIEGAPNAILEAMAMERPVVVTDVGGISELVQHGLHGFLVPPDNGMELFIDYIEELFSDQTLCKRMGKAGRSTILNSFCDRSVVERLANIIKHVAFNGESHLPEPKGEFVERFEKRGS